MASKIQVRRDSTSGWANANPVLDSGEIGLETTTGYTKIGDGSSTWSALSYLRVPQSSVTNLTTALEAAGTTGGGGLPDAFLMMGA